MSDTLESSSSSSISNTESAGKCPVDFETRSLWSLWGTKKPTTTSPTIPNTSTTTPASLEEAAKHAQTPHPDQRLPLSTHRLESTIPRSSHNDNSTVPAHQIRANEKKMKNNNNNNNNNNNSNDNNWIYPSEQQVFNAMKRKGWKGIEEESIPSFLQIHNSVNEQSWNKIQEWEASTTSSSPYTSSSSSSSTTTTNIELGRFEGRPRDLTPKAWFLSTFGISNRPFDRHDWYVVNKETGIEKRYVLDFYMQDDENNHNNNNNHKMIPRVEIDVRPALDSPEAVWQRGTAILRDVFPGIARELQDLRKR